MSEDKAAEYVEKLAEHEAKRAEKARLFNPAELVKKAVEIREVEDPELGIVRFGALTMADLIEIAKAGSNEERSIAIIYCMLKKAHPNLTKADVENLPLETATRLLNILSKQAGFLAGQTAQP